MKDLTGRSKAVKPQPNSYEVVVRRETAVVEQPKVAKPLITTDEFGEGLHNVIGRNAIYALIQANRIKHIRIGRKILILRSELIDFPSRESESI